MTNLRLPTDCRALIALFSIAIFFSAANAAEVVPPNVSWVWDDPQAAGSGQSNDPRYLRGTIKLTAKPKEATLFVTVDNRYEAFINGQKLGGDASWNSIDRYDVAAHLVVGPNVVAIQAQNEGGSAGAIAWLKIVDAAGKSTVFGTGADWRVSQVAAKNWQAADFDDSAWSKCSVLGDAGIGPWNLGGGAAASSASGNVSPTTPDVNISDPKVKEYRPAAEELASFEMPKGFKLELVAAEPLVINPVCMVYDAKGRLYVSESHTYRFGPKGSPVEKPTNPIVRLDPTADGKGLKRVVVAEGFDDPVMGMSIRGNQLWASANNYLYRFDLTEAGLAENKTLIFEDKNKAWNPFGMFVLEWGPDGLLYLSVGDHSIDITGKDGTQIRPGKHTGVVMRMRPDGTKLESLVHGLRVPYSFEFDPFGQLWVLSNGEGNPNRFLRVIQGVDYHCFTRSTQVGNEWLAGRHPLAPPCFELPRGACTQLVRYYGSAYPAEYQGNLFLDNWGAHGFGGPNRTIFRYLTDDKNNVVEKQGWIVCRDPHFRCSHLMLDAEGNLMIADWYGRDDESDLTGRIWRVRYEGEGRPVPTGIAADPLTALGSPNHLDRETAIATLAKQGATAIPSLAKQAEKGTPIAAASALWALSRISVSESQAALTAGTKNADGRVRRLALDLLQRDELFAFTSAKRTVDVNAVATSLANDADLSVRLEAAEALSDPAAKRAALVAVLKAGVAEDLHLRYEAAWQLAKVLDAESVRAMATASDPNLRLAGMIALDVACYENLPTKPAAVEVLAELIANPAPGDWEHPLTLARLTNDAKLLPALEKLGAREDVPADVTARTILALRSQGGAASNKLGAAAARRFLDAVQTGKVKVTHANEQLLLLELLPSEGPTPFALREIQNRLTDGNGQLRDKAHQVARDFGEKAGPVAGVLKSRLLDFNAKPAPADKLQWLATLAVVDPKPDSKQWERMLLEGDATLARDALRTWRVFLGNAEMTSALVASAPKLLDREGAWDDDLRAVLTTLKATDGLASLSLPEPKLASSDEKALREHLLAAKSDANSSALGRRVFERAGCVKCHTTVNENALRAPSLQGIGKAQKVEYLVESIFEPSKVIKTGFEIETVVTTAGQTYQGLVKEEGGKLRIITVDKEIDLAKSDVEERVVQKKSLMPEGLYKDLSPSELRDLVSYLQSLK